MKENFRGDEKPYCVCGFILWSAVLAARLCLTHEGSTHFPCQQSKQLARCPPKPSTLLLSSHFSQSMGHRWGEIPRKKGGRRCCQTAVCRELTQQRPVDLMMALNRSTFTHTCAHFRFAFAIGPPTYLIFKPELILLWHLAHSCQGEGGRWKAEVIRTVISWRSEALNFSQMCPSPSNPEGNALCVMSTQMEKKSIVKPQNVSTHTHRHAHRHTLKYPMCSLDY